MDEETKKWIWETYKACHAVLLMEHNSVLCISVWRDEDDAKHDCKELQSSHPGNRYTVVAIPIGKVTKEQ